MSTDAGSLDALLTENRRFTPPRSLQRGLWYTILRSMSELQLIPKGSGRNGRRSWTGSSLGTPFSSGTRPTPSGSWVAS